MMVARMIPRKRKKKKKSQKKLKKIKTKPTTISPQTIDAVYTTKKDALKDGAVVPLDTVVNLMISVLNIAILNGVNVKLKNVKFLQMAYVVKKIKNHAQMGNVAVPMVTVAKAIYTAVLNVIPNTVNAKNMK
jgi:hypothetical protein